MIENGLGHYVRGINPSQFEPRIMGMNAQYLDSSTYFGLEQVRITPGVSKEVEGLEKHFDDAISPELRGSRKFSFANIFVTQYKTSLGEFQKRISAIPEYATENQAVYHALRGLLNSLDWVRDRKSVV